MKIVFTGGGTAGHVSLNKVLIPLFLNKNWEVHYIGSKNGMEKEIITSVKNVKYHEIHVGKLRRFVSIKNITDPFKVLIGIFESIKIIKRIKPNVIFSKGGFVSFPVSVAGKLNNVPVILHESDISLGLANKLSLPFCNTLLTSFKNTKTENKKEIYIGGIVRDDLKFGKIEKGLKFCNFNSNKPIILITGGSLGSKVINDVVRECLSEITKKFNVIHLCGKGNLDSNIKNDNYRQYEFITTEFIDLLSCIEFCITRGGANTIFEMLSIKKPMIIIPLDKNQSRGDQIENAIYFEKKGYCKVLYETDLTSASLLKNINYMYNNIYKIKKKMDTQKELGTLESIVEIIEKKANN